MKKDNPKKIISYALKCDRRMVKKQIAWLTTYLDRAEKVIYIYAIIKKLMGSDAD